MSKANPEGLRSDRLDGQADIRLCDHPDCAEVGEYRAPKDRSRLGEYYWFCLDHVREYNRAWNYYAGMSDSEVEAEIRRSTTWDRPTWKFGTARNANGANRFHRFHDPFDILSDDADLDEERRRAGGPRPASDSAEARAAATMGLEPPFTLDRVKQRYKELVKKHHPDANGGDKAAEERLKSINDAYTTLRRFLG